MTIRYCNGYETDLDENCLITINSGDMFEGYPHHFADCFFSNVFREVIEDWCESEGMTVTFTITSVN